MGPSNVCVNKKPVFFSYVLTYWKSLLETMVDFSCPGDGLKKY